MSGQTNAEKELYKLSDSARQEIEQFRRSRETKVLTIFFSDLVDSTELQFDHGNIVAAHLVQIHYGVMRKILKTLDGKEISTSGDSMLIVFTAPSDAVRFALLAQRQMRLEQSQHPLLPCMRCGIHHGQVVLQKGSDDSDFVDIYGVQVSMAARIMGLCDPGQILMSRAVYDDARTILAHETLEEGVEIAWRNHGAYLFKGIREECDVCEVGETMHSLMHAPGRSEKAWPVLHDNASDASAPRAISGHRAFLVKLGVTATLLCLLFGTLLYFTNDYVLQNSKSIEKLATPAAVLANGGDATLSLRDRITKIDTQLARLSGIEEELQGMAELDAKYKKARNLTFGNEPNEVRVESILVLSRLRTFDLTEAERELVDKADKMASQSFIFYPEEVYVIVRQLADQINRRRKQLAEELKTIEHEASK